MRLKDEDIRAQLSELRGWRYEDQALRRTFSFDDFVQAFGFLAQVALLAEQANHHPEIRNVYGRVELALSTHDVGGVSAKDFALARKIDVL